MTNYIEAYQGIGYKFAVDEAQRLAHKLTNEATVTDGVIRWNSNNGVPPADCVELAAYIGRWGGLPVDVAKCDAARDADMTAFLAVYRANRANRTPDQIAEEAVEARAAHGPGVTLVNVLTGEKFVT